MPSVGMRKVSASNRCSASTSDVSCAGRESQISVILEEVRRRCFGFRQIDSRPARALHVALIGFGLAIEHGQFGSKERAVFQDGVENGIQLLLLKDRADFVEELSGAAGLAQVIATALECGVENRAQRALPRTGDTTARLQHGSIAGEQECPAMFGRDRRERSGLNQSIFRRRRIDPAVRMQALLVANRLRRSDLR